MPLLLVGACPAPRAVERWGAALAESDPGHRTHLDVRCSGLTGDGLPDDILRGCPHPYYRPRGSCGCTAARFSGPARRPDRRSGRRAYPVPARRPAARSRRPAPRSRRSARRGVDRGRQPRASAAISPRQAGAGAVRAPGREAAVGLACDDPRSLPGTAQRRRARFAAGPRAFRSTRRRAPARPRCSPPGSRGACSAARRRPG